MYDELKYRYTNNKQFLMLAEINQVSNRVPECFFRIGMLSVVRSAGVVVVVVCCNIIKYRLVIMNHIIIYIVDL